jgi:hypothetical protein
MGREIAVKTVLRLVVALLAMVALTAASPVLPPTDQVDRGMWHIADPDPPTGG